jgi:hypothetical protein
MDKYQYNSAGYHNAVCSAHTVNVMRVHEIISVRSAMFAHSFIFYSQAAVQAFYFIGTFA